MKKCAKLVASFYFEPAGHLLAQRIAAGFEFAETVFKSYRLEMTGISCICRQQVSGIKDHKYYSFKHTGRRILAENTKENLAYLSVDHVPADAAAFVAFDWLLHAGFGVVGEGPAILMVGVDYDLFVDHAQGSLDQLLGLCKTLSAMTEPEYGFATVMPRDQMPNGYAIGLGSGDVESLVLDANAWSDGASQWYRERVRNVHALNFVSSQHLAQPVGDQSLGDWITAHRKRGSLEAWDGRMFLWSVIRKPDWPQGLRWDGHMVATVREELEGNRLFPWQDG
jgi:hypothetical protein